MNRKTAVFLIVVIILAAVGVSVLAYPKLPDRMASHWGPSGQVDGWMSRSFCVWFMPGIMVFITVVFSMVFGVCYVVFPSEPYRKNCDTFFKYYGSFVVLLCLFLFTVHSWMVLWNMGIQISSNIFMPYRRDDYAHWRHIS